MYQLPNGGTELVVQAICINLSPRESECIACGATVIDCHQGFAMIEGEILAADDPRKDWGGFDACDECFQAWSEGGPAAVEARVRALEQARRECSERDRT